MSNYEYEEKKQAHRRAVHEFIDTRLSPAIADRLSDVLPEYDFTRSGGTWYSRKDLSGSSAGKKQALYCTPKPGYVPRINGNGSSAGVDSAGVDVLTLYAEKNSLGGRDEAAEAIADLLGISGFPKWEGYAPGDSSKEDKRESDKEKAAAAFTRALLNSTTPGAEEARAYLLSRFTEDEYKAATARNLLGYVDSEVLAEVERTAPLWHAKGLQSAIGTTHKVAITTEYCGRVDSFNFRTLPATDEEAKAAGLSKYLMPSGTSRDVLGGLSFGAESVIVVEGEIDRLKATLAIDEENRSRRAANKPLLERLNVVSVGTNTVHKKNALNAIKRGAKYFTIIPDVDKAKVVEDKATGAQRLQFADELPGYAGTARSIETLYAAGAQAVYIAQLPEDEGGEKVDTADYISRYGLRAWYAVVRNNRVHAVPYLVEAALKAFIERAQYYGADEEARDKLFTEIEGYLYSKGATYDSAEKAYAVLSRYLDYGENRQYFRFSVEAFRAYVEAHQQREEAKLKKQRLAGDIEEAYKAATGGDVAKAAALLTDSLAANTGSSRSDYAKFYSTPASLDEVEAGFKEVVPGVGTGIFVHTVEGEKREITLKEGVSLVVGARKHGKTTFLCNIALNEAAKNVEAYKAAYPAAPMKKVLLITYEVRKNRLQREILAMYLHRTYKLRGQYVADIVAGDLLSPQPQEVVKYIPKEVAAAVNKEALSAYYDKGIKPVEPGALDYLQKEGRRFIEEYLITGALTIIDLTDKKDVEDLEALLTQYLTAPEAEGGISLIALDYIQKLNTREKEYKGNRPAALKYIGERLTDFGVKHALPILAAAQFNRISSLLDVDTKNIGEAGDLERNAVDVIGLYNLKELAPLLDKSKYAIGFGLHCATFRKFGLRDEDFLQYLGTGEYYAKDDAERGIKKGEEKLKPNLKPIPGKLYISLMASRYGGFPAEVIADFNGSAGYVDFTGTSAAVDEAVRREEYRKREEAARYAQGLSRATTTAPALPAAAEDEEAPEDEEDDLAFLND